MCGVQPFARSCKHESNHIDLSDKFYNHRMVARSYINMAFTPNQGHALISSVQLKLAPPSGIAGDIWSWVTATAITQPAINGFLKLLSTPSSNNGRIAEKTLNIPSGTVNIKVFKPAFCTSSKCPATLLPVCGSNINILGICVHLMRGR